MTITAVSNTPAAPGYSAPNTACDFLCPLDLIRPSARNPRKRFDDAGLADLAASIQQHGLLEPLVVREIAGEVIAHPEPGSTSTLVTYELIAGERRYRAAKLAGLTEVPVRSLGQVDDKTALELALVENLQRQDLDPIEEAEGYRQLNRVVGLTQAEIAAAVKRSQPAVANAMRLLKLPQDVQDRISAGALSVSHGIALCRYQEFPAVASALAAIAVERRAPTKDLEADLPFAHELVRAKAVRVIDYTTPFKDTCQRCPYNARRKTLYSSGDYCLKPEHFDTLQAEYEARLLTQRQVARAASATVAATEAVSEPAAVTSGAGAVEEAKARLPKLRELRYGDYEELRYGVPAGCTEDCPCRSLAVGQAYDTAEGAYVDAGLVQVCLDPQRFRQLKIRQEKAAKQARRETGRQRLAQLQRQLAALETVGPRELAVVVAAALASISRPTCIKEAAAATGVFAGSDIPTSRVAWTQQRFPDLATLSTEDALKFALEALLREEIVAATEGYYSGTRLTDWYLDGVEPGAK